MEQLMQSCLASDRWNTDEYTQLVRHEHVHPRFGTLIHSHIQSSITFLIKERLFLPLSTFNIQTFGTFLEGIAFRKDPVQLVMVHNTKYSEREIIEVLKSSSLVTDFRPTCTNRYLFAVKNPLQQRNATLWRQWCQMQLGAENIMCTMDVVPVAKICPEELGTRSLLPLEDKCLDLSAILSCNKSTILRQQLSRYLRLSYRPIMDNIYQVTALVRLMARENGIDSIERGFLSPSILQLFVLRYLREIVQHQDPRLVCPLQMSHLAVAKFVCTQLAHFEFRAFIWAIEGDLPRPGDRLRVRHPLYPSENLTELVTPENTKSIIDAFLRAAHAKTLNGFVKGTVG